jgi:hypothetical protein
MNNKALRYFIIGTFVTLYLIVSVISTIHVIDFFRLSNPNWLAISLAVAFEIGAAASLASLIALKKMNRSLVWGLFITLTCMQMMGNTYYAFKNLENFQDWVDLFGLTDSEPIFQKRILSIISGAVLPLVALGFIKSLVDYIKPSDEEDETPVKEEPVKEEPKTHLQKEADRVWEKVAELRKEGKLPEFTEEDLADEPTALANSQYRLEFDETDEETVYTEDTKKQMLTEIMNNNEEASTESPTASLTDEQLNLLEAAGELTKEDIENYKEKTRIPERGKNKSGNFKNPQIMPGVN